MTDRFGVNGGRLAGRKRRWRSPVSFIGLLLIGAAVIRELRLPPRKRTWHGLLWRRIPYDLRPPNPARIAHAVWAPNNPRLLVPTAFGVGWTLNLAALFNILRG